MACLCLGTAADFLKRDPNYVSRQGEHLIKTCLLCPIRLRRFKIHGEQILILLSCAQSSEIHGEHFCKIRSCAQNLHAGRTKVCRRGRLLAAGRTKVCLRGRLLAVRRTKVCRRGQSAVAGCGPLPVGAALARREYPWRVYFDLQYTP